MIWSWVGRGLAFPVKEMRRARLKFVTGLWHPRMPAFAVKVLDFFACVLRRSTAQTGSSFFLYPRAIGSSAAA